MEETSALLCWWNVRMKTFLQTSNRLPHLCTHDDTDQGDGNVTSSFFHGFLPPLLLVLSLLMLAYFSRSRARVGITHLYWYWYWYLLSFVWDFWMSLLWHWNMCYFHLIFTIVMYTNIVTSLFSFQPHSRLSGHNPDQYYNYYCC